MADFKKNIQTWNKQKKFSTETYKFRNMQL